MAIKQGGVFVVLQRRSSAKPGDVNLQATRLVLAAVDWSRWGTADRKLLNALTGEGGQGAGVPAGLPHPQHSPFEVPLFSCSA